MPTEDVEDTIRNVRKAMRAGLIFLFTHDEPRLQIPTPPMTLSALMSATGFAYFRKLADKYDMAIEDVSSVLKSYPSFRTHMFWRR